MHDWTRRTLRGLQLQEQQVHYDCSQGEAVGKKAEGAPNVLICATKEDGQR
jgi:hypothetical protein